MKEVWHFGDAPVDLPTDLSRWHRPSEVALSEDRAFVLAVGGSEMIEAGPATERVLREFLELTDVEGVLRFCRRYGLIEFCPHGMPWTHWPQRPFLGPFGPAPCRPVAGLPGLVRKDPVASYLAFAEEARAILSAVEFADTAEGVPPEVLEAALRSCPVERPLSFGEERPEERRTNDWLCVRAAVETWLELGDVRLQVAWGRQRPQLTFGGATLFGAIAHLLALAAFRLSGPYVCGGCGAIYTPPGRRPKPDEPRFCPECQDKGVPAKLRQQRRRERLRREQEQEQEQEQD